MAASRSSLSGLPRFFPGWAPIPGAAVASISGPPLSPLLAYSHPSQGVINPHILSAHLAGPRLYSHVATKDAIPPSPSSAGILSSPPSHHHHHHHHTHNHHQCLPAAPLSMAPASSSPASSTSHLSPPLSRREKKKNKRAMAVVSAVLANSSAPVGAVPPTPGAGPSILGAPPSAAYSPSSSILSTPQVHSSEPGCVTLSVSTWNDEKHSLRYMVEFSQSYYNSQFRRLCIVDRVFAKNKWKVIVSDGKEYVIEPRDVTFQFVSFSSLDHNKYSHKDIKALEIEIDACVSELKSNGFVEQVWNAALSDIGPSAHTMGISRSYVMDTLRQLVYSSGMAYSSSSVLSALMLDENKLKFAYAAHAALCSDRVRFTSLSGGTYLCHNVRHVEEHTKKDSVAQQTKRDEDFFILRLLKRLMDNTSQSSVPVPASLPSSWSSVFSWRLDSSKLFPVYQMLASRIFPRHLPSSLAATSPSHIPQSIEYKYTPDLKWNVQKDDSRLKAIYHFALHGNQRYLSPNSLTASSRSSSPSRTSTFPSSIFSPISASISPSLSSSSSPSASSFSVISSVLQPLQMSSQPMAVYDLCIKLGICPAHENIHFKRAVSSNSIAIDFPASIATENSPPEAEVAAVEEQEDRDKDIRRDLTHHRVFAIDDSSTEEVDDGLSLEYNEKDQSLWIYIHIADVERFVQMDSPLEEAARSRAKTIYLPEKTIFMLPKHVSVGKCSLSEERDTCVLTFACRLNSKTGGLEDFDVYPAKIAPVKRLTYEKADEIIRSLPSSESSFSSADSISSRSLEEHVRVMYDLALARGEFRRRNGALTFESPKPMIDVSLSEDGNSLGNAITLQAERGRNDPAQVLVSEMMILGGEIGASFASSKGFSVPYRIQEPPNAPEFVLRQFRELSDSDADKDNEIIVEASEPAAQAQQQEARQWTLSNCIRSSISENDVRHLLASSDLMRYMSPARVSFSRGPHSSLGLSGYTQVTSPIRRYADLLCHYQIKSWLRTKTVPFSHSQMMDRLVSIEPMSSVVDTLQKDSLRFWALQYLELNAIHRNQRVYKALILESWPDNNGACSATVLLLEVSFKTRAILNQIVARGSIVTLEVNDVAPHADGLALSVVSSS